MNAFKVGRRREDGFDYVVTRCTTAGIRRERPADPRFRQRAGVDLIVKDCAGRERTRQVAGAWTGPNSSRWSATRTWATCGSCAA
ncbi:hypothetical protein ACGFZK_35775 [Streptomyces sp. NPDC048257]|uniref:hypothetical protein n=1 Tax=Streptomyces sp. NPDC048257 TaxID=3365526 RepID=UPI00371A0AC4